MSNYFTAYEAKKNQYKQIQPGTVWKNKFYPFTLTIKHIDSFDKIAYVILTSYSKDKKIRDKKTFDWIISYYTRLS